MESIILCAGYSTRLYPLTLNKSKCLLKIANKPILEHIVRKLEPIDELSKINIVTNAKFYNDFEKWFDIGDFKTLNEVKRIYR